MARVNKITITSFSSEISGFKPVLLSDNAGSNYFVLCP